jgi:hypothetical protein
MSKETEKKPMTLEDNKKRIDAEELAGKNGKQGSQIEPKDVRFKRLAGKRMNAALKRISYIRNLSNRNQYTFTVEQVAKINAALAYAVTSVADAFAGATKATGDFAL